ncbi:hypothetical protein ACPESR_16620 [Nocardia testacea]|uniref:hypothetical protein n=1 Tax=Nocardia testacea TaxID=248551 RepID=UPI003C2D2E19
MISGAVGEAFDFFDAAGHDEHITGGNHGIGGVGEFTATVFDRDHGGIEMLSQATGHKPSADTARATAARYCRLCGGWRTEALVDVDTRANPDVSSEPSRVGDRFFLEEDSPIMSNRYPLEVREKVVRLALA